MDTNTSKPIFSFIYLNERRQEIAYEFLARVYSLYGLNGHSFTQCKRWEGTVIRVVANRETT